MEAHREVFEWVLALLAEHGAVQGSTLGVDSSTPSPASRGSTPGWPCFSVVERALGDRLGTAPLEELERQWLAAALRESTAGEAPRQPRDRPILP